MQSMINASALSSAQEAGKVNNDLFTYMKTNNSVLQETMSMYNQFATDDIQKENLFTSILSALVVIIIFFMLIK